MPGAAHVKVWLDGPPPGAACPACGTGTLFERNHPGVLIRFVGQVPMRATIPKYWVVRTTILLVRYGLVKLCDPIRFGTPEVSRRGITQTQC